MILAVFYWHFNDCSWKLPAITNTWYFLLAFSFWMSLSSNHIDGPRFAFLLSPFSWGILNNFAFFLSVMQKILGYPLFYLLFSNLTLGNSGGINTTVTFQAQRGSSLYFYRQKKQEKALPYICIDISLKTSLCSQWTLILSSDSTQTITPIWQPKKKSKGASEY